jgi:formate--tetrahydrofolate ligase
MDVADEEGVRVAISYHFTEGGTGAVELAEAVAEACAEPSDYHRLYPDELSLVDKIDTIAREMYGADGLDISPLAAAQLEKYERAGFGNLPVCIAKTHLSLSADPRVKGAPTGWRLPVREVRASIGAGFIYPICGDMRTMPGLSSAPAAERIDIDESGDIVGLS